MEITEMTMEELFEEATRALNHSWYYKDVYPNWSLMEAASDRHQAIQDEIERRRLA